MKSRLFATFPVVVFCVLVATVHAQRRYELIVEGTDVVSQAERTPQRLVIIDARNIGVRNIGVSATLGSELH